VEKTEATLDKRQIAMMTTTFVALLLISQLSMASDYSNSQFLLDSNFYDSLETGDLESNSTDRYTPDFVSICYNDIKVTSSLFPVHLLSISYNNNAKLPNSIRAPPLFS
jgi:hypothetical protein